MKTRKTTRAGLVTGLVILAMSFILSGCHDDCESGLCGQTKAALGADDSDGLLCEGACLPDKCFVDNTFTKHCAIPGPDASCVCKPECVPNCTDKVCGDDGCGGSCGVCIDGLSCSEDQMTCGNLADSIWCTENGGSTEVVTSGACTDFNGSFDEATVTFLLGLTEDDALNLLATGLPVCGGLPSVDNTECWSNFAGDWAADNGVNVNCKIVVQGLLKSVLDTCLPICPVTDLDCLYGCVESSFFTSANLSFFGVLSCMPTPPLCGNGVLDDFEPCDGTLFGGMTCTDFEGMIGGDLGCTDQCTFDTSACEPECVPDCDNMVCGLDPVCGESCGECLAGELCSDEGLCEPEPVPEDEVCYDGVDNDLDGLFDGEDSDCCYPGSPAKLAKFTVGVNAVSTGDQMVDCIGGDGIVDSILHMVEFNSVLQSYVECYDDPEMNGHTVAPYINCGDQFALVTLEMSSGSITADPNGVGLFYWSNGRSPAEIVALGWPSAPAKYLAPGISQPFSSDLPLMINVLLLPHTTPTPAWLTVE